MWSKSCLGVAKDHISKRNKGVLMQLMESEDNTTIEAQEEDWQLEVQGPFDRISGYFP
jgi:hypothetical protein